jgi:hypothetical protein
MLWNRIEVAGSAGGTFQKPDCNGLDAGLLVRLGRNGTTALDFGFQQSIPRAFLEIGNY